MSQERQRYSTESMSSMAAYEAPESGNFFGQVVLVAGGGGIVGAAVVELVLREGGTVFAVRARQRRGWQHSWIGIGPWLTSTPLLPQPVRNEQSRRRLLELLRDVPTQRLRFIVGDYTTKPGALTLTTFLNSNAQRGLNHVVSIHGEKHHHAALADITGHDFLDTMSTKVLPHIVVAQAAVAHVVDRKESSYTIVTGRMGQRCEKADEALLCIANAASYGVASALRAQCREHGVKARIPELRIGCVVKRDQAYENPAFPGWAAHNASAVARYWARSVASNPAAEEVIQCTEEQLGVLPQKSQRQQQQQGGKVGQQQQQQQGEIRVQEA